MSEKLVDQAKDELEAAQSALEVALRAWDESVTELWRTSLALTQAQQRVTRAYDLLRSAVGTIEVDMH
jgi:exonuclease VII small subunit